MDFITALTKLEPRAPARPRHFHAPPTSVRAVCAGSERTAREPALRRAETSAQPETRSVSHCNPPRSRASPLASQLLEM